MRNTSSIARRIAREDADPALWPVANPFGFRIFMVDCPECGNRMAPNVMAAHKRRHGRLR